MLACAVNFVLTVTSIGRGGYDQLSALVVFDSANCAKIERSTFFRKALDQNLPKTTCCSVLVTFQLRTTRALIYYRTAVRVQPFGR